MINDGDEATQPAGAGGAVAKRSEAEPRRLPGSRIRVSTAALAILFGIVWWIYDVHHHNLEHASVTQQVVPPDFVPDPAYTWVPRTMVGDPTTVTQTVTETVIPPPVTETVRPHPKPHTR